MKYAIAVDLGASSGKMAIGHLEKEKIVIDEYRNFVNRPVDIGTALYWGVFSLYNSVLDGLTYFKNMVEQRLLELIHGERHLDCWMRKADCWNRYIIIVIEERSMSWKSSIKI